MGVQAFTFIYNSSGKYSITPESLDSFKVFAHCSFLPMCLFEPDPIISVGKLFL